MSVIIKEITTRSDLKRFVKFAHKHYKGNPYYVPTLVLEEMDTLNPKKNPAFDFCDHAYFMAYKDGKAVGRIAGIINRKSNEIWNQNHARFGWIEFTDDHEVSEALLNAVEEWAEQKGADAVHGPIGFTDLDHEGLLIEGFDQLGTMATIYNYDYYPEHLERLGYQKDSDWIEYRITVPEKAPERFVKVSEIVKKRYQLNVLKLKNSKELLVYGTRIFELLNAAYSKLYGYTALNQKQIDYYIKMYLPMLRLDFVTLITDADDNLICFGISIPSLSKALQKSKGKLFPFGFIRLLLTLKGKDKHDTVDLYLVAVRPDYQGKGVNALLFNDLVTTFYTNGYFYAESNPELETNTRVQSQWEGLERKQHKRRRAYIKKL